MDEIHAVEGSCRGGVCGSGPVAQHEPNSAPAVTVPRVPHTKARREMALVMAGEFGGLGGLFQESGSPRCLWAATTQRARMEGDK
jgi:hypothetical protein